MAEKHGVSSVPGAVPSPRWRVTRLITQHPGERGLLSLCIIAVRKLPHKEFHLPRFTLLRSIGTRIEPRRSGCRPVPFCLSQFLLEDGPLARSVQLDVLLCDLPAPSSPTSSKSSTFGIGPPSNGQFRSFLTDFPDLGPMLACHLGTI